MASNLCEYLEASAAAMGENVAVVQPDGRALTYRELNDRSRQIASLLMKSGVQPGDRVGVVAPKSADVVAALFGIMKAGASYVPADYTAPIARTQAILSDCAVTAVFLDPSVADIIATWPGGTAPHTVIWLGDAPAASLAGLPLDTALMDASDDRATRLAALHELAYILYTSGSTGVPKGVSITHENATSFVDWCSAEFEPQPADRFSSHAPFHFDLSIFDLYVAFKHGATLFLIGEQLGKTPKDLALYIANHRLTVWYSTPSILGLLAQFGGLDQVDCSALRLVLFAGEVFPVKHLRDISDRWPDAAFYNLYGPTETNVCTFARIPLPVPPERTVPYPIGLPCAHCQALVLDEPGGQEVPSGEEGLLHIAGPAVFPGYWNRPEGAAFFQRNGLRWYNTGDVVRESPGDGFLYVGRRDRMVKRRGYRIELAEIERGLYRSESIREAAAIAVQDETAVRIVAYVTPQPGVKLSIIELKMFCSRELPSYMNPDVFMLVDALPRTSTNKVDYQKLQETAGYGTAGRVTPGGAHTA